MAHPPSAGGAPGPAARRLLASKRHRFRQLPASAVGGRFTILHLKEVEGLEGEQKPERLAAGAWTTPWATQAVWMQGAAGLRVHVWRDGRGARLEILGEGAEDLEVGADPHSIRLTAADGAPQQVPLPFWVVPETLAVERGSGWVRLSLAQAGGQLEEGDGIDDIE